MSWAADATHRAPGATEPKYPFLANNGVQGGEPEQLPHTIDEGLRLQDLANTKIYY